MFGHYTRAALALTVRQSASSPSDNAGYPNLHISPLPSRNRLNKHESRERLFCSAERTTNELEKQMQIMTLIGWVMAAAVVCQASYAQTVAGDPLDTNSIKRDSFELTLSSQFGSGLEPGAGVNMANPFLPRSAPISPFLQTSSSLTAREISASDLSSNLINSTSSYYDDLNVESESRFLAAYFRASYMFTSIEAALQKSEESRKTGRAVYFIYSIGGWVVPVRSSALSWSNTDLAQIDSEQDPNLLLRRFIGNYGSHFVQSVKYGARIAIRAQLNTTDQSAQRALSAKVQAAFGKLSAEGGMSQEERQELKALNLSIQAEVTAGGVVPSRPIVLTGFEEVATFLADFKSGRVKLVSGPLSATLQSYWPTLDTQKSPRLVQAFAPATGPTPSPAPFGLPAGSVIAWRPKAGDIIEVGADVKILPPQGWLVCDGSRETPDLRGKWIVGTAIPGEIGGLIGDLFHTHRVSGATNNGNGHTPWSPGTQFQIHGNQTFNHAHSFDVESTQASNAPPSIRLVYIMKE